MNDEKHDGKEHHLLSRQLLDNRTVLIYGEIDQDLARRVTAELLVLHSRSNEPITVFLNSQGGHVEAGDTIHDMIRFVNAPVTIVGTGWVASAGTSIYLSVDRERRLSLPNTRYMIHQPMGGVRGQTADVEIEAQELIRIKARINQLISDATGRPLEQVKQDTERNHWLSNDEAIDYGIVGRVIEHWSDIPGYK